MVSAINRQIISWNLMKIPIHDEMATVEFNMLWDPEKGLLPRMNFLKVSKYILPSQINLIFTTYTNLNSLKLKIVVKNFSIRCDGRDNTKNLCNFIPIVVP